MILKYWFPGVKNTISEMRPLESGYEISVLIAVLHFKFYKVKFRQLDVVPVQCEKFKVVLHTSCLVSSVCLKK
jgi:hypothetical protein